MLESFANFLQNTGLYALISSGGIDAVKTIIMIAIACVLLYLAIVKKFEPLLLLPIAFGMLLSNLPMIKDSSAIMMHTEFFTNPEYMTDNILMSDISVSMAVCLTYCISELSLVFILRLFSLVSVV